MTALRERIREQPLPGEAEAAARSWPLVEAALESRPPTPRRSRTPLRLAILAGLLCLALVTALSPAGAWIEDRFESEPKPARPAFAGLPPKAGPVLAISRSGAYAVGPRSTRQLGSFSEAGWSPRGLHAVGVDGRRVTAVTPRGTVKWSLIRPGHVHDPAWSTGLGFAVAYLEGRALRVVAGTGDPKTDRRVRRSAAAVTPAWRPHSDSVLSYVTAAAAVETVDVDSRARLWRTAPNTLERPLALTWSRDGRRLVALTARSVIVFEASGHVLRTLPLPGVARELALHPSGERAAVLVRGQGGGRALEVPLDGARPRQLFQGDLEGVAWSRNGRRLLLGWRGADQWLLLGPGGRIRSLHGVTRELGARGGFPRVAGWCCSG
jgi:hypothetical protein